VVLTWLAFYASLPVLSLSVAAVAVYTNPIMTTLLAPALIGEPVGRRQWLGVLSGFLGVIAILKPGGDAFPWFTLLPLLGAAFCALAVVLTRSKCRDEAPLILALNLHGSFLVTGLMATAALALIGLDTEIKAAFPFLFGHWAPMGQREWGLMALIAALSVAFFIGAVRAHQIAPPPIIATFDYSYIVSAVVWGFVFFAETPDVSTIGGMILIAAAGLLVSKPASK
jgi:drug/metabolite transporter (DMT)-like permease